MKESKNSSLRQAYESLLRAMNYVIADKEAAEQEAKQFIMSLPEIKRKLQSDIVTALPISCIAKRYLFCRVCCQNMVTF